MYNVKDERGPKMKRQDKSYTVKSEIVDADDLVFDVTITTEAVDRDGDIVRALGGNVDDYLKNPVVLFGHNYWNARAVVGKTLEIHPRERQIDSRFQFASKEISEDAALVGRLWAHNFLNAASIGFLPTDWREIKEGEPDRENVIGYEFLRWNLLEWSVVPVPANQEALRRALELAGVKSLGDVSAAPTPIAAMLLSSGEKYDAYNLFMKVDSDNTKNTTVNNPQEPTTKDDSTIDETELDEVIETLAVYFETLKRSL
jgi:hypothetical protein